MDLFILFGQREESYPGQYAPEPLTCWSEFEVDDNPAVFTADVEAKAANAKVQGFVATRLIRFSVNEARIREILTETPTLEAVIKP